MKKNQKPQQLTKEDIMKLEVADELGLLAKINAGGWGSLNAKESGRIGGIITQRIKQGLYTDYQANKRH